MTNLKIRFGCHSFLNAQPLIYALAKGLVQHNFELVFDTPSNLANLLRLHKLDLAIIPSIEYARNKEYLLIPDYSICSKGEVKTVALFSKKEIPQVKKIAADKSSRSSITLLQIWLKKKWDLTPEIIKLRPHLDQMLAQSDAALLIGDAVFKVKKCSCKVYDLGREWFDLTRQSFVHALLAVHPEQELENEIEILHKAKEIGISRIEEIARIYSKKLNLDYYLCKDYLSEKIHYDLGAEEIEGLRHFYRLSQKYSLIKKEPEIRFYF